MGILSGEGNNEMITSILHANENKKREDFENDQAYIDHLKGEIAIASRESDEATKLSFENPNDKELVEKAIIADRKLADLHGLIEKLEGPAEIPNWEEVEDNEY